MDFIWEGNTKDAKDIISEPVILDGCHVNMFTIQKKDSVILIWCDSHTHLPLKLKAEVFEFLLDFPDDVPTNIYELGVQQGATVVEIAPNTP